jgi:hypothetical protein
VKIATTRDLFLLKSDKWRYVEKSFLGYNRAGHRLKRKVLHNLELLLAQSLRSPSCNHRFLVASRYAFRPMIILDRARPLAFAIIISSKLRRGRRCDNRVQMPTALRAGPRSHLRRRNGVSQTINMTSWSLGYSAFASNSSRTISKDHLFTSAVTVGLCRWRLSLRFWRSRWRCDSFLTLCFGRSTTFAGVNTGAEQDACAILRR